MPPRRTVYVDGEMAQMLGLLLGCGLRRSEAVGLSLDQLQSREGHWVIVDFVGKGKRLRTVPVPSWSKELLNAWLRHSGVSAEVLEGGTKEWLKADLPMVTAARLPPPDRQGRTVWVTRSRPKVDRIACPWLIRRFVDPRAVFLFVAPADVAGVAQQFAATPFDVEGAFFGHRGDACTFDAMLQEFGLTTEPLLRLASIVRAADMDRIDAAPQASGLLAASLGLSRMFSDDLAQLEAGLGLYDAFYRWCRDAVEETHVVHVKRSEGRRTKLST